MADASQYLGLHHFRVLFLVALVLLGGARCSSEVRTNSLLRVANETSTSTTCILLDDNGSFHFESDDHQQTKVYEGQMSTTQLEALRPSLRKLSQISQADIEEPLIHGPRNLLDVHLFGEGGSKELLFRSSASQRPYATELNPLLRWMYDVHKLPHRELSEDAGKRNCLPRGEVVLKTRQHLAPQQPSGRTPMAGRRIAPPSRDIAPNRAPIQPLVRLELIERISSGARQTCALVADDGQYRLEHRFQKNEGRRVENSLAQGRLPPDELNQLHKILETPSLSLIRHREPPAGRPLNIKGAVLELSIHRTYGSQQVTLTDSTRRSTFFYPGDGDITAAGELLAFLQKHIEPQSAPIENASRLNGCGELP